MPPTPQDIYIYIYIIYIYIYIYIYMDIYGYMAIYGHIWVYTAICGHIILLYIYIHNMYMCLSGRLSSFSSSPAVTVALYLPMFSALTPHCCILFRNRPYENVPMDRGIILCFQRTVGFDLVLPTRVHFFEKTLISPFVVYLQRSIMHKLGKAFMFLRFPFGKGSYFVEIPILLI